MERLTKRILKIISIFLLLLINLIYVSIPSINKYLDHGIVIEVSTASLNDVSSPAFTFSRIGPDEL